MIIILLLLLFFSNTVYAETYAIERDDGGVSILNYNPGARDSLSDILNDLGFSGNKIKLVTEQDLPETKEDRKYWKLNDIPIGKKVIIDTAQKQADEAALQALEQKKADAIQKLGISAEEFKDLFYGEAPETGKKNK